MSGEDTPIRDSKKKTVAWTRGGTRRYINGHKISFWGGNNTLKSDSNNGCTTWEIIGLYTQNKIFWDINYYSIKLLI